MALLPDLSPHVDWLRADSTAVDAVEVGVDRDRLVVFVRSSLTRRRAALSPVAFSCFVEAVKAGKFDRYVLP